METRYYRGKRKIRQFCYFLRKIEDRETGILPLKNLIEKYFRGSGINCKDWITRSICFRGVSFNNRFHTGWIRMSLMKEARRLRNN